MSNIPYAYQCHHRNDAGERDCTNERQRRQRGKYIGAFLGYFCPNHYDA